jgi:pimeloyl-ACP methyl ester carboxylesterase
MYASPSVPEPAAVVFIHGIGGGARLWDLQVESFAAARFRPLAVNLPGYGPRPPVSQMSFESLVADLEAAIDAAGLTRPVLVGHSMGGMVAQAALRRRPDGHAAAVLACTSPAFGNPSGDFQKKFIAERLAPLEAGRTMADVARGVAASAMAGDCDPAGRALAIAAIGATPELTYRAAVRCLVTFDERANLAAIRVPVLCVAGGRDPAAPPTVMERMAARIPGARYIELPGRGHFPNLEAPGAFDAAVFDFLHEALEPVR